MSSKKSMKALHDDIDKLLDGKKIKGCNLTVVDIHMLVEIYNALVVGNRHSFIQEEVKNLLDKCGIKTREQGIGWVAIP